MFAATTPKLSDVLAAFVPPPTMVSLLPSLTSDEGCAVRSVFAALTFRMPPWPPLTVTPLLTIVSA